MDIRSDVAGGNSLRSPGARKNTVVFGPNVFDIPLLPYEKQLIKTISVTEEEYKRFAAEARRRGAIRPAEYEHIPDIQAALVVAGASYLAPTVAAVAGGAGKGTAAVILTNVAVSLVLTGVAYLLTPKPKQPEASKRTQLDLGSVSGASRFTPTSGFDTITELADYGAPIPIIFGLYNEEKNIGGMLITPKLVWSRMFSHGTQQSAKLMFVVGEQGHADAVAPDGIEKPDLEGIYLGNNALDALYEDFFAFYWKRNSPLGELDTSSGFNRLRFGNLAYGTSGGPSKGDPEKFNGEGDDAFLCPSDTSDKDESFCHAFSLTNNARFGMYGALPNGNAFRVNYEVVSIPDGTANRQVFVLVLRRIKIVGAKGEDIDAGDEDKLQKVRKQDQEGTGRQYSPRMGITKLIKTDGSIESVSGSDSIRETQRVQEGDIVEFTIVPTSIPEDKYQRSNNRGGESVGDINGSVEAEQIAADEAMQIGEEFAIGNTRWVVFGRTLERFDPEINDIQKIRLRCIDNNESRQQLVGLVSEQNVVNPSKGFIADESGVGAAFFPITRTATGIVRNNKPAVVTEIGIRSKVFQRLNGLCAFNTVPTPNELDEFDDEEVSVRSGTYTGTIIRSSVFQVFVRKAGLDANGDAFRFSRIDVYFVVRGSRPVDQYNFIRFTHPRDSGPQELEYKFVGIPASELRALSDDQEFIQLYASVPDTQQQMVQDTVQVSNLGTFEIEAAGLRIAKIDLRLNKEFIRKPITNEVNSLASIPSAVRREIALPQDQNGKFRKAISMDIIGPIGNQEPPGRAGSFYYEIFGRADSDPGSVGTQRTAETREVFTDKWLRIRWTVQKVELSTDNYARQHNNQTHTWSTVKAEIIGSSFGWSIGEANEFKRGVGNTSGASVAYGDDNPFKNNHPDGTVTFSGFEFVVTNVETTGNAYGRTQGYYYAIFGDAQSLAIGTSKTVTRDITKGSKQIRLQLTVKVFEMASDHYSGLQKGWQHPEVIEIVDDGFTTSSWDKNDTFDDLVSVSANNNPFYTAYDQVGFRYKINDVRTAPKQVRLSGETIFEHQSQYADLSHYRSLVQKSNESEPEHSIVYVNEILPNKTVPEYGGLTLAGLSLKAGRNFTALDQMRCWVGSGLHVKRLHPDFANSEGNPYDKSDSLTYRQPNGPSNLFSDLVYYLLTDKTAGAGNLMGMSADDAPLLNVSDFQKTSRFLHKQELFFNGVIVERTNLRQYITDIAPYFLCNLVIMNGKFSLLPAIPNNPLSGETNVGPVAIDQLFTAGNILEDSYKLEYLRSEERRAFKAVIRYRHESRNKLPEQRVMEVTLNESSNKDLPQEQFDLTQFCTSRNHAIKVAQYFLGIRKLVTHTISFSTTVHGLNLRAGSYIKVITEATPYSAANTGTVNSSGVVTSVSELADGEYSVSYFKTASEDVEEGIMQVSGGVVADSTFHDTVFTIKNTTVSQNVYVVEQLTFSQEGTVDIVASEHPCDSNEVSKLAKLLVDFNSVNVEDI